jgi:hypothetical protein
VSELDDRSSSLYSTKHAHRWQDDEDPPEQVVLLSNPPLSLTPRWLTHTRAVNVERVEGIDPVRSLAESASHLGATAVNTHTYDDAEYSISTKCC